MYMSSSRGDVCKALHHPISSTKQFGVTLPPRPTPPVHLTAGLRRAPHALIVSTDNCDF